ncbi:MAG: 5-dehydro-2-deoxygluconokinase [Actinomyces sp.]|nr:MAG: 5-dehydro-2-deoxygluconokinase [Actinomyces sp.]
MTSGDIEALTIGRVSVDLYPLQTGVPLARVESFAKFIGGSPTNVAIAAARLGRRTAVVTRVGDDGFGDYIRTALAEEFGVDNRWVSTDPDLRTALAFCALDPPEDPPLLFYREPRGPDMNLTVDDVPLELVERVPVLWVTGSRFAEEPSRSMVTEVLARRGRRSHTVLDLDYRPMFWPSPEAASAAVGPALDAVTVAVGNRTECEIAVGTADPDAAADRLLERGVELAIVKKGAEGVLVATPQGRQSVAPLPVDVVCGLGAGDAFGGALVDGLLAGLDPVETIRRANAAGAIVAGRLACSSAMPTTAEIDAALAAGRAPSEPPVPPGADR